MKNIHQYKDKKFVNNVFDNVYENYDLMNDIMSFGSHRLWKEKFVNSLDLNLEHKIVDMASGTGDISQLILKKINIKKYTVLNRILICSIIIYQNLIIIKILSIFVVMQKMFH